MNLKSNLTRLAVACMVMASGLSLSAQDNTAVPFVLESSDPADNSTVESLKVIKTVWTGPEAHEMIQPSYNSSKTQISVTNAAGEEVTNGRLTGSMSNGITINLSQKITDPGTYTVTVKANTIYLADQSSYPYVVQEGTGNEEVSLHYTIPAPAVPFVLESSDPADNSTVESLKVIKTVWTGPEAHEMIQPSYNSNKTQISVTNAAGEEVTNGRLTGSQANGVTINLSQKITEPGEYTVTIKANTIYLADQSSYPYVMQEGTGNEEVSLHFTIATPAVPFVLESADPEDGATVESLKVIKTVWTGPEAHEMIQPSYNSNKTQISVTNAAGEEVTNGRLTGSQANGVTINLSQKITEPGEYTVTIKANTIYLADQTSYPYVMQEGTGNEECSLHYTVGLGSGINEINADTEEAVYYNMNGVRVLNPTEGIFIKVSGDKVEKVVR